MPNAAVTIKDRFHQRADQGRGTLIPYLTAGFPDTSTSEALMSALAEAGADVLELGIPFSDPLADGPTIQRTSFEALQGGMTTAGALELLERFRRTHDTPVVLFTYLNPVLRFGPERFLERAVEAGAQGLLLTDLPAGADAELEETILSTPLDLIRLLAPTTPLSRAGRVATGGRGFLYYISRTGVTGAREEIREELGAEVAAIRETTELPVAVGFGISTPEQAAAVSAVADGVVVGSALMEALDRNGVEGAASLLRSLREGMDRTD
jgi:tryptophan synthase alpha chain